MDANGSALKYTARGKGTCKVKGLQGMVFEPGKVNIPYSRQYKCR
jgi:hypothetical protein